MREFFKPWQRKIGVVTLLMACMFSAIWVRSTFASFAAGVMGGFRFHGVVSTNDGFVFIRETFEVERATQEQGFSHFSYPESFPFTAATDGDLDLNLNFAGIVLGREKRADPLRAFAVVPYWLIVAPLILVSGWLMLSKPPVKKKPVDSQVASSP